MRRLWRLNTGIKKASSIALGLLLTLSACSIPEVTIEKADKRALAAGKAFGTRDEDYDYIKDRHATDKKYLATVHIRFSEHSQPVSFDVRRDRHDTVRFNMMETKETSTYLHMGYSRGDGGSAGLRFTWRF